MSKKSGNLNELRRLTFKVECGVNKKFSRSETEVLVSEAIKKILGVAAPSYRFDTFSFGEQKYSVLVQPDDLYIIWAALSIYGQHFGFPIASHLNSLCCYRLLLFPTKMIECLCCFWVMCFTALIVFCFVLAIFFSLPKRNKIEDWKMKHVFITGGSKGIGKQLAFELLRHGCCVTIAARNRRNLEEVRQEMDSFNKSIGNKLSVNAVVLDVTSTYKVIESVMDQVESEIGPVDVLINNAGSAAQGAFEDLRIEDFEEQIRLNYLGAVYVTRAVIERMKERRSGHVGFVCSAAGQFPLWGYTAYAASKYALRGFAEALFMELLPCNVGVSILYPPNTDTEGFKRETLTVPPPVAEITKKAGLFTPDVVARKYIDGIENGDFSTTVGFEGWMLGLTTAGSAQEPNFVQSLYQVLLAGWLRGVVLVYLGYFNMIVKKFENRRR